jgi:ubiquinone/menaquinone biosynthesis C-methylase UbiE
VERDEYRRQSFEAWETMAAGWERARERIEQSAGPVREWLVRELEPQPGDTVLELAAGPGETGFEIVGRIPDGRLISSDRSPAMVEVARRRAAELGLANVEHRVLDAEELDLPDASVDGVICRFGYMLMADPARALAETRRVLRLGGRLVFAAWREGERNPWVALAGRMFVARGLVPPPEPGAPGMFTLASDEKVHELLAAAGFTARKIEDIPVLFVSSSLDEYVESSRETGGIFARVWDEAPPGLREDMAAELAEAFAPFQRDGRYELPGVAVGVAAE